MRRRFIWALALPAVALLLGQGVMAAGKSDASKKEEKDPFTKLTVDQVQKKMAEPNVHVYDGNNDDVYKKGHLPGAVHIFSKDITEGVLPADKSTPLIFYCHNEL